MAVRRRRRSRRRYGDNARKHRRRRRSNPLFRTKSGKFARRGGRRLRRIGGGGWHNNPRRHHRRRYRRNAVVPVSWNAPRRRHRRHYRRNSILPYSWNPGGVVGELTAKLSRFVDVKFWTDTAIPAAAGFAGTKVVGGMIKGGIQSVAGSVIGGGEVVDRVLDIASNAAGASLLSWAVGKFISREMGEKVFLGGVVSIAHSLLKAILPADIAKATGFAGIGDDLSDRMKEAVAARLQAEMAGYPGVGAYLTQEYLLPQVAGVGEFVTDVALRRQPGYSATPSGDLRDYDATRSETTF